MKLKNNLNRICTTCQSPYTYTSPKGIPYWFKHINGHECLICYNRRPYVMTRQRDFARQPHIKKRRKPYMKKYNPIYYNNTKTTNARKVYYHRAYNWYGHKEKKKDYYGLHREEILTYKKQHRRDHLEEYKEKDQVKYQNSSERRKAYQREYYWRTYKMKCITCNTVNNTKSSYCWKCGLKLHESTKDETILYIVDKIVLEADKTGMSADGMYNIIYDSLHKEKI